MCDIRNYVDFTIYLFVHFVSSRAKNVTSVTLTMSNLFSGGVGIAGGRQFNSGHIPSSKYFPKINI